MWGSSASKPSRESWQASSEGFNQAQTVLSSRGLQICRGTSKALLLWAGEVLQRLRFHSSGQHTAQTLSKCAQTWSAAVLLLAGTADRV